MHLKLLTDERSWTSVGNGDVTSAPVDPAVREGGCPKTATGPKENIVCNIVKINQYTRTYAQLCFAHNTVDIAKQTS